MPQAGKAGLAVTQMNGLRVNFPFTLDLSEFNVSVMTGNNGAHQRSPYDPGIQK